MIPTVARAYVCLALVAIALPGDVRGAQGQTTEQAPRLRSGVTLVPVNVRVLDRNGHAVRDLTKDDFEILEDGVPQPITQFQRVLRLEEAVASESLATPSPATSPPGRVFLEMSSRTLWDLANVHKGIEYLHYTSGEKHLFFVTRHGLFLAGVERDNSLARAASNARVTLDILYTEGPVVAPPPAGRNASSSAGFQQMFATSDMRAYAEPTGGQFTAFRSGRDALERLDDASRSYYLLGYEPADRMYTRKFRQLSVRVKRPGDSVRRARNKLLRNCVLSSCPWCSLCSSSRRPSARDSGP